MSIPTGLHRALDVLFKNAESLVWIMRARKRFDRKSGTEEARTSSEPPVISSVEKKGECRMKLGKKFRTAALTTVIAVIGVMAVQQAFAASDGSNAQSTVSATKGAKRITAVREDAASSTTSTSFVTLSTASVTIPAGTGLMVAHFSGEALCGGSSGWCSVRILIDGTEMVPQSGTDFAFAAVGNNFNSSAVERTWQGAAAGAHTFTLQYAVTAGATSFRLDDWVFDVEYWRQT
jgi:hypothetical protein